MSAPTVRRLLSKHETPVANDGCDDVDGNLIIHSGDRFTSARSGQVYAAVELLGSGSFGTVIKCMPSGPSYQLPGDQPSSVVALKVVRNHPAYFSQATMEIHILTLLRKLQEGSTAKQYLSVGTEGIVALLDHFTHCNHLCLVFEFLPCTLLDVITRNKFRGISLPHVRLIMRQVFRSLHHLHSLSLCHADIKLENIMVCEDQQHVKMIDFGSSSYEGSLSFHYIQSRFYRAPEVMLGLAYDSAIDLWSAGCVAAELYLGLPIFPGCNEHDQIGRIAAMLGHPPEWMLECGAQTSRFFAPRKADHTLVGVLSQQRDPSNAADTPTIHESRIDDDDESNDSGSEAGPEGAEAAAPAKTPTLLKAGAQAALQALRRSTPAPAERPPYAWASAFCLKTTEEFAQGEGKPPQRGKQYYRATRLESLILGYDPVHGLLPYLLTEAPDVTQGTKPLSEQLAPGLPPAESRLRMLFLDFLSRLLAIDPRRRMTSAQALVHPFLSGAGDSLPSGPAALARQPAVTDEGFAGMTPQQLINVAAEDLEIRRRREESWVCNLRRSRGVHAMYGYAGAAEMPPLPAPFPHAIMRSTSDRNHLASSGAGDGMTSLSHWQGSYTPEGNAPWSQGFRREPQRSHHVSSAYGLHSGKRARSYTMDAMSASMFGPPDDVILPPPAPYGLPYPSPTRMVDSPSMTSYPPFPQQQQQQPILPSYPVRKLSNTSTPGVPSPRSRGASFTGPGMPDMPSPRQYVPSSLSRQGSGRFEITAPVHADRPAPMHPRGLPFTDSGRDRTQSSDRSQFTALYYAQPNPPSQAEQPWAAYGAPPVAYRAEMLAAPAAANRDSRAYSLPVPPRDAYDPFVVQLQQQQATASRMPSEASPLHGNPQRFPMSPGSPLRRRYVMQPAGLTAEGSGSPVRSHSFSQIRADPSALPRRSLSSASSADIPFLDSSQAASEADGSAEQVIAQLRAHVREHEDGLKGQQSPSILSGPLRKVSIASYLDASTSTITAVSGSTSPNSNLSRSTRSVQDVRVCATNPAMTPTRPGIPSTSSNDTVSTCSATMNHRAEYNVYDVSMHPAVVSVDAGANRQRSFTWGGSKAHHDAPPPPQLPSESV